MERRNKNRWEFLEEPISIIAMKNIVNGLKQTQKNQSSGGAETLNRQLCNYVGECGYEDKQMVAQMP